uniref:Serrate RNA effector molecule homolog n=1 Tax=Plectus sambesii TaxID=2011161 RepID=A0A914V1P4_9BILA
MADSDDEYDHRRPRDKFARERNVNEYSGGDRSRPREYGGDRRGYQRDNYGNGGSAAMKRPVGRRDEGGYAPKRARMDGGDTFDPQPRGEEGGQLAPPPVMMTFKRFLATQEDSITDELAIQKYQEYKLEFKRQELHKFFIAHKDEEWFRLKYHPDESAKRKEHHKTNVHKRFELFQELTEKGMIEQARLDYNNGRYLIKLMDALVVKIEGGTDEDVTALDDQEIEDDSLEDEKRRLKEEARTTAATTTAANSKDTTSSETNAEEEGEAATDEQELEQSADEHKLDTEDNGAENGADNAAENNTSKERDEEGALSDTDSDKAARPATEEKRKSQSPSPSLDEDKQKAQRKQMLLHKTSSIFLRNVAPSITIAEVETLCKRFPGFLRVGLADPLPERKFYRRGWVSFRRDVNIKEICWNLNNIRLRDCDLGAIVNRDLTRRVRTVNGVTVHKSVAQNDLRLASKLVQIYDKRAGLHQDDASDGEQKKTDLPEGAKLEFGIESKNPLLHGITEFLIEEASAEEEELLGTSQTGGDDELKVPLNREDELLKVLDRIVVYLRLVHSVDYYNHGEYPHEDEMPNRCGMIHVRGQQPSTNQWGADEANNPLIPEQFHNEFTKGFTNRLQNSLMANDAVTDDEALKLGKKDPEKEIEAFITANTVELAKDKWLCPLSGKKFKGPEFIRKHLTSKHQEKLDEVKVEVSYFNNYLYDPKRPQNPEIKPLMSGAVAPPPASAVDERRGDFDRGGGGGYNRGGGGGVGGGWNSDRGNSYGGGGPRNYGGNRGYQQHREYAPQPPRDFQQMPPRNRAWGEGAGGGRRDPREPITYKDLDAPEDIY